MWGVEILANAVETILHQHYLAPLPRSATIGAIAMLALVSRRQPRRVPGVPLIAGLAALGILAVYVMLATALFEAGPTRSDLVYPPAALVLAFGATLIYRVGVFDEAEQRSVAGRDGALSLPRRQPVGARVIPDRLRLGGERREMTVLFSDLRRFTTVVHELPPEVGGLSPESPIAAT